MRNFSAFKVFVTIHALKMLLRSNHVIMSKFFYWLVVIAKTEAQGLKIIPVVDVLGGIAVHAVRGRREEYRPLKSVLCASTDPVDVAAALKTLGFSELYVADLDAITGGQPNFSLFKKIADKTGLELMVDAGVTSLEKAEKVLRSHVSKVIIGTETLPSTSFVAEAVESFGSEKIIVSLDLMGKRIISGFELGRLAEPIAFLRELEALGVCQIIVLDLARVGSGEGINMSFLQEVQGNIKAKVFVGGGVRDVKDLLELKGLGVFGVLVATALHLGKISPELLKQAGLL
jgi:phosphoribosylformimino-5-aminoimidazole carboxamide ribotide isomerase